MKKYLSLVKLLVIAVATLTFFSCSKKDSPGAGPVVVTGKWNITADTSQTVGYAPYIIVGINSPYMQFNADGTGTQKNNISTPDVVATFTYSISKDTISFNYQHPFIATPKAVIKKMTSKNLVLEYFIHTPTLENTERVYMSK